MSDVRVSALADALRGLGLCGPQGDEIDQDEGWLREIGQRAALRLDGTERPDGLTTSEGAVMDGLVASVNAYAALPVQHPNEMGEFVDAIHRCQDLLAVRIARRHFPEGWPIKTAE